MYSKSINLHFLICYHLVIILSFILFACSQDSEPDKSEHTSNVEKVSAYVVEIDGSPIEFEKQEFQGMAKKIIKDSKIDERNISEKPDRKEIKEIAEKYGLFSETIINPHLSFLDGDISYWAEQGLSLERLRLEFAARKIVLDAAEKHKIIIGDQGKLSWAAQQIMSNLLKERQEILTKN